MKEYILVFNAIRAIKTGVNLDEVDRLFFKSNGYINFVSAVSVTFGTRYKLSTVTEQR